MLPIAASAYGKLFPVWLGLFGFTCPRIIRRISPRSPTAWHVGKGTDRWIALVCTAETDHERVVHVCGCATQDLPVPVEIVAHAQDRIPLQYNLASRNRNCVGLVRERPIVGRKQMLVLVCLIAHEFIQFAQVRSPTFQGALPPENGGLYRSHLNPNRSARPPPPLPPDRPRGSRLEPAHANSSDLPAASPLTRLPHKTPLHHYHRVERISPRRTLQLRALSAGNGLKSDTPARPLLDPQATACYARASSTLTALHTRGNRCCAASAVIASATLFASATEAIGRRAPPRL